MRHRPLALVLLLLVPCLAAAPAPAPAPAPTPAKDATASKAKPFEKEIKAFEEADERQAPPQDGILFVGSSSIRLWKTLKEDFPGLPVINRGFGGSRTEHVTLHADRIVLPYRPRQIVFYSGDNDLNDGLAPARVRDDLAALLKKVHAALPQTRVVILAVKPSVARVKLLREQRETNRLFAELAAADPQRLTYVDIFTPMLGPDGKPRPELYVKDNLHMNAAGYQLWTSLVKPHVK